MDVLLTECWDEAGRQIGRTVDTVLAQNDFWRRALTAVELNKVLKQVLGAKVKTLCMVNEDLLRVDDFLALVDQGSAHGHQLHSGQSVFAVRHLAWVVAQTCDLE